MNPESQCKSIFQKAAAAGCRKGFTLIEVIIAMLLFSIGILAAASMQAVGRNSTTLSMLRSRGSSRAAAGIESILSMDYSDPVLADTDGGYYPEHVDHGPFISSSDRCSIEWEVEDDFPAPNCKRITFTIRFQGPRNETKVFSYDYVKARDFI